jgi:hypothetical protein
VGNKKLALLSDAQRIELRAANSITRARALEKFHADIVFDPGRIQPPLRAAHPKASADLTGVRRPDENDSINFFRAYLIGLNSNAHAPVMEFAARSSILCAPDNEVIGPCYLTHREGKPSWYMFQK